MKLKTINLSTNSDNADIANVAQGIVKRADALINAAGGDAVTLHRELWSTTAAHKAEDVDPASDTASLSTAWMDAINEATVDYVQANRSRANFLSNSSAHDSESLLTIAVLISFWHDLVTDEQHINAEHRPTLTGLQSALATQTAFIIDSTVDLGPGALSRLVYEVDALAGRNRGPGTPYDLVAQAVHAAIGAQ